VQRDLVESIVSGDRVRARAAAVEYCDLAKARVRQILVHSDGRL
jgi:DNA-binding FadR family transcriptional regulator